MTLSRKQLAAIYARRNKELGQVRKVSLERGVDHGKAREIIRAENLKKGVISAANKQQLDIDLVRVVSAEKGVDHAQARKIIQKETAQGLSEYIDENPQVVRKFTPKPTLNQKKAIFALTMQSTNNIQKAKQLANKPKTRDEASEMIHGLTIRSS